jgi:hypothetical protein
VQDLVLDVEVQLTAQEAAQVLVDEVIEGVAGGVIVEVLLDRVPEDLYGEIVANTAQHEEWMKLGFTTEDTEITEITEEYLKENPFLVLDTKFFDESFKDKLLASIENLDEQCTRLGNKPFLLLKISDYQSTF